MTSDPTVRAVWEDWLLESGRALGGPRVVLGCDCVDASGSGGYDGHGGWGYDGGDGGWGYYNECVYSGGGSGTGCGYDSVQSNNSEVWTVVSIYGGGPTIWRRRD
jgi:hypothetical protein